MTICNKGYQWLTGLLHGTYWCIWTEVKDKVIYRVHKNVGKLKEWGNTMNAFGDLKHIFEENALPQPHLQQTMVDGSIVCQYYLPLGMTKKVVFETINRNLQESPESQISSSTMYKIWCLQFGNVKTPSKQWMSKFKTFAHLKNAIEYNKCNNI